MKAHHVILLVGTLIIAGNAFAQAPANNLCTDATNLGSLPVPISCSAGTNPGVGATINASGTTVNATYPDPYTYQPNCIGGGNQAAPSPDVWYVFTLTGTVLNITLTATFANPNIALWTPDPAGSGCSNLQAMGCAVGNAAGTVTISMSALAPGTVVYMQVSSNNKTTTGTFNMTIGNDNDCSICMTQSSVTTTPPPVNGSYQPGQTVQMCLTISGYNEINNNWLHGLEYTFGPGWDLATLTTTPAATCVRDYLGVPITGTWGWYNSVTSAASGATYGPGFFFDGPSGFLGPPGCGCTVFDHPPGDNYGDYTDGTCVWTFCITLQVSNVCAPGQSLDIDVTVLGDGESGSWTSFACSNDPQITFTAFTACCPPTMTSTSPSCAGNNGTATATPVGTGGPWTYAWSNGTTQTALSGASTITNLGSGAYSVTVTDVLGCTSTNSVTLTAPVVPTPAINPTAQTICNGSSTPLTASGGVSYTWSTNETSATINVSPNTTTTYFVTVTGSDGCTATTSAVVTVNPIPATPVAGSNTPLCVGNTLNLTASTVAGATYSWSGPNGFSSTQQDPSITNVVVADAGTYTVTTIASGCTSTPATADVVINPIPAAPNAGSNTPLCAGATLNLTASTIAGATYSWSGPNGFSSTQQDPSITNVVVADAGTYTVTAIASGCTSTPATTDVVINPIPATPVAGSNTPLCVGNTLNLTASTVAGVTYSWSGPNGFSSTSQDPSITNVVVADAGTYTVTTIAAGCTSTPATTVVVINPIPAAPTAGSNSPLCAATTLNLSASTVAGATYSWSGPNGFTSATQDPSIANVVAADAGTYTVTAIASGCTSTPATVDVVINPIPATPIAGSNTPLCAGATLNLTASTVAGATYSWSGPNGFSSTTQNPSIINVVVADAGTYTVTSIAAGCSSIPATADVVINPIPAAPIAGSNTPLCVGATLNLTASTVAGSTYSWSGPNGFSSTTQDPSIANVVVADAGTYTVTASAAGCTSTPATATVVINPIPATPIAGSNTPLCAGATLNLTASTVAGSTYSWSGPNGFSSAQQDPSIVNVVVADAGTYSVTAIASGCTSTPATADVVINLTPAPVAGSNTPLCVGSTLNLTASTVAGATYNWSGPNGFTSTLQDPSITNAVVADAGTYTVTAVASGCTSTPATATVVINANPVPVAGSNTPLCAGTTLNLATTNVAAGSYSWSGPNGFSSTLQDPSIANVITADAGTYTVIATVNSCTGTASTLVAVNPLPIASVVPASSNICNGQTVNLTASGGVSYAWSNAATGADISVTPLATTTYTVTVTDANGCSATASANVDITIFVTLDTTVKNVSCNGGSDGGVFPVPAGGQSPYTFIWSNNATTQAIQGVTAGTYTVTATDAVGCVGTVTATVSQPTELTMNSNSTNISCNSNNNGTITITGNGGTQPYTYSWSDGPATTSTRTGLTPGAYTVTVTDNNNCTISATVTITQPEPVVITSTMQNPTCISLSPDGNIIVNVTGGTTPYVYSWSGGESAGTLQSLPPGAYALTVTDANECTAQDSFTLVYLYNFSVTANPSLDTINLGDTTKLGYTLAGTTGTYNAVWGGATNLSCTTCSTPLANPDSTVIYTITVTNDSGCTAIANDTVVVLAVHNLFVPNAFTPNGDGINDFFNVYGNLDVIKTFEIKIFDRWGEIVYESSDPLFKWDGSYKGTTMLPGVLVYSIEVTYIDGYSPYPRKGSLTLIR